MHSSRMRTDRISLHPMYQHPLDIPLPQNGPGPRDTNTLRQDMEPEISTPLPHGQTDRCL